MREIKFRAWGADKKIHKVDCISFSAKRANGSPVQWEKLMQYTGLKDKNGNDIYEGDILKGGAFVKYHEAGASFIFTKSDDLDAQTVRMSANRILREKAVQSLLVIGNIYENPELIEK